MAEYKIEKFINQEHYDDEPTLNEFNKFLLDADIILTNFGFAFDKGEIESVEESHFRGAQINLKDRTHVWGYQIWSKLINK